jgi:hypothetical protein
MNQQTLQLKQKVLDIEHPDRSNQVACTGASDQSSVLRR